MKSSLSLGCLAAGLVLAAGMSVELNDKTFDAAVEGKSAFIMFQAPW